MFAFAWLGRELGTTPPKERFADDQSEDLWREIGELGARGTEWLDLAAAPVQTLSR